MSIPRHLVPAAMLAGLTALTLVLSFALPDPADASVGVAGASGVVSMPAVSFDDLKEVLAGEGAPPGRALLHRDTDGHLDGYRVSALSQGVLALGLENGDIVHCLLYTSPSPRDKRQSRMPSSA